jgi:hypothetical protein
MGEIGEAIRGEPAQLPSSTTATMADEGTAAATVDTVTNERKEQSQRTLESLDDDTLRRRGINPDSVRVLEAERKAKNAGADGAARPSKSKN